MSVHEVTVTFNFITRRPDTLLTIFLHVNRRFIVFINQSPLFLFIKYTFVLDVMLVDKGIFAISFRNILYKAVSYVNALYLI